MARHTHSQPEGTRTHEHTTGLAVWLTVSDGLEDDLHEFLVVDDARSIWVYFGNHLIDLFLVQIVNAQVADDVLYLPATRTLGSSILPRARGRVQGRMTGLHIGRWTAAAVAVVA